MSERVNELINNIDDTILMMQIQQKKKDCYDNAKQRAIDKLVEKYYTKAFQLQLQRGVCTNQFLNEAYNFCKAEEDIEKQRLDKLVEEKGYKDKTEYTFITINPRQELNVKPNEMNQEVEKIIKKTKWINQNDYAYVIEQRSNDPSEYSGVHCHMLVHTKDKPNNEIRRELKNKVGHLMDMEVVKSFDIGKNKKGPLSILPTENPENRLQYMLDWKKDPDKHAKQIVDKQMREQYQLDKIYYQGEKISQLIIGHQECQQLDNIRNTADEVLEQNQNILREQSHTTQ